MGESEDSHMLAKLQEIVESMDERQKEHTQELRELRQIVEKQVLLEERHQQNASSIERAFKEINDHRVDLTALDRSKFFLQGALYAVCGLGVIIVGMLSWALKAQIDIAQNLPLWKYDVERHFSDVDRRLSDFERQISAPPRSIQGETK